jgi:hypothetical protein
MARKTSPITSDPEGIKARDALIDQYIEIHGGRYRHLTAAPDVRSSSDSFEVSQGLFGADAATQRDEMKALSDRYFNFRIEFFKFSRRPDRDFADMWKRPLTHSDLAEEDIELKFPEDRKARALIKAFHAVMRSNQWRHIRRKRYWQFIFGVVLIGLAAVWTEGAFRYCSAGAAHLTSLSWLQTVLSWAAWTIALMAMAPSVWFLIRPLLRWRLENTTEHFKEANQTSCANLRASMTTFNATVSTRFTNLLNVIKSSEDNAELVKAHNWPLLSRELFKIAMWEGKRIESMEQFWQMQFERLRLLELWTDRLGNLSSILLAGSMIVLCLAVLVPCSVGGGWGALPRLLIVLTISALGLWRMGVISRRSELSFGIQDIISQGFESEWQAFGSLGYYDKISQEFENGMGAKRMEKIRDRTL